FQLGCGHGLPGIFACLMGSSSVHFQDFNAEVLQSLTIPIIENREGEALAILNYVLDWEQEGGKLTILSYVQDWRGLNLISNTLLIC
ncbi:unnamed protein product, partial [Coffea canephora]